MSQFMTVSALVLLSAPGGTGCLLFDRFLMHGCRLCIDGIDRVVRGLVVMGLFNLMGDERNGSGMSRSHSVGEHQSCREAERSREKQRGDDETGLIGERGGRWTWGRGKGGKEQHGHSRPHGASEDARELAGGGGC